ncbi:helix-turn-helix transcriptional regulator [Kitasatospora sp. NPDC028055]|uniref:helix-turn-helix transcriptional regulator n=1 Tax=Kitasatospora sp. NPDC028055 TaxID=3155653 RepID=UPI0033F991A8
MTLAELGEMARLSPFHMARLFRQETGLPPASFLTTVRLEEARRRLLRSSDSVADIAVRCGYTSVGAFTTRFTKEVGVPPGRFRRLSRLGAEAVDFVAGGVESACAYGSVRGQVERSDGLVDEPVFVAAFAAPPGGQLKLGRAARPARCHRIAQAGAWRIPHVPEGTWVIQSVSRAGGTGRDAVVVATAGPLRVVAGEGVVVRLRLAPPDGDHPDNDVRAVLGYALPDLFVSS